MRVSHIKTLKVLKKISTILCAEVGITGCQHEYSRSDNVRSMMSAECVKMAALTESIYEGETSVVKVTISSTMCCSSTKCSQGGCLDTWFLNGKKDRWPPARNFCDVTKQKVMASWSTWFLDMKSVSTASSLIIAIHFQAVFHVTGETIRDIHFKCLPYFCTHPNKLFVIAVFWGHSRRLLVVRLASLMKKCKMWLHKQAEIFVDSEESRCYWSVDDMPWNNGDFAEKWHSCTEPVCLKLTSKKTS